ncbi:MAG: OmpA family protein [Pseudomonadota bacterium]
MSRLLILIAIFCGVLLTGCQNAGKKPPVVTSNPIGEEQLDNSNDTNGLGQDAGPEIGVLEEELPIEERAFLEATRGNTALLESLVVYFDYDSSEIKQEFMTALQTHARFLEQYPNVTVSIAGHCDERGSPEYNMALGFKRAEVVSDVLRGMNVSRDQFSNVHSFGSNRPIALGSTEEDYEKNRRVEITYKMN